MLNNVFKLNLPVEKLLVGENTLLNFVLSSVANQNKEKRIETRKKSLLYLNSALDKLFFPMA